MIKQCQDIILSKPACGDYDLEIAPTVREEVDEGQSYTSMISVLGTNHGQSRESQLQLNPETQLHQLPVRT